ncbi:MAG: Jag N-terminal domain-containing protein [Desulfovibrionaceae bacterium]
MLQKAKIFRAKTLENAMQEACKYFALPRESLEITVIQAAKSGIFGIVPVQDAEIKVFPLSSIVKEVEPAKESKERLVKSAIPSFVQKPKMQTTNDPSILQKRSYSPLPVQNIVKVADIDVQTVISIVEELVKKILMVLVDEVAFTVKLELEEVRINISDGPWSAILIGKDHENLLAIQYIVSRILNQQTQRSFLVSVCVGEVTSSEENMLISMALRIATKVKSTQKTQQTLPLPAYQRRIIHMTLQDDPLIGTTTKGSDTLQSVVIFYQKKHQEKVDLDVSSIKE